MRVWTVSEAKAGTLTQVLGVARLIDGKPRKIIVRHELPRWRTGLLSPYRRLASEPDIVISCGGFACSHVAALVAACRVKPFTVHLATPKPEWEHVYDMAFISRHDWDETKAAKPNFHPMVGVPHQLSTVMLSDMRAQARQRWLPEGAKAVTVLAGGPNRAYVYDDATIAHLVETIRDLTARGWTALVSTSRRSRPDLLERLLALRSERIVVWDRKGENPYRDFLAAADALLVTKDSITMVCEAATTGKPAYVFDLAKNPGSRLDKFEWFHADMSQTLGLSRAFEGDLAAYRYSPLDEAQRVAGLVREAFKAARPQLPAAGAPSDMQSDEAGKAALRRRLDRTEPLPGFPSVLRAHRKWLAAHGLLDRPWLILGAAPNPTIPSNLPSDTVYAYVRFAGRSARRHGLPDADITLLPRWKDAQRDSGLSFKQILRLRRTLSWKGRLNRILRRDTAQEAELTTPERDDYIIGMLGSLFPQVERRPSNGVALICFAIAHEIPKIIVAGVSFEFSGHEYERSSLPRRHILEDAVALRRMRDSYPSVTTTEESLSIETGLPLYRNA